jgi:spermidine synthase
MASPIKLHPETLKITVPTRYLCAETAKNLFNFAKDLIDTTPKPSTLDRPTILTYYLTGWKHWN